MVCGGIFKKPKMPAPQKVAPAATVMENVQNVDDLAAKKARRRYGFSSTQLSKDRTILGAVGQASDAMRKTLG